MRRSIVGFFAGLAILVSSAVAMAQEDVTGVYQGLDGANGITIRVSPEAGGYRGEIAAASGGRTGMALEPVSGGLRGPLTLQGRQGTVELKSQPLGLSFLWTPDGGGDELIYAFRRESLPLPRLPAGYAPPPPPGAERANPIDFVNSYEFWEAADVGRAYDGMDDKFRVILKTFATVHTDIVWKLCRAPIAPRQLVDALRGQGVTCADVETRLKASQTTGGFSRFKQQVAAEKVDALLAVECARGINQANVCLQAAQRTQAAALSLETVGSVLRRF